jgi:hypothetical protein
MNTRSDTHPEGVFKRLGRTIGRLVWALLKRGYAAALIVIVLWLSWQAVHYLVSSLLLPARPPAQIVDIDTTLTPSTLLRLETSTKGGRVIPRPRTPLSHYHQLDAGFQTDRLNGCTISQCHAPLPHGKNKADRAFLNMHATSIHCAVCHLHTEEKPLALAWYDLKTGKVRAQAPALLRAYAWLTSPKARSATTFKPKDQLEIVNLLRSAAVEAYGDIELNSLAEHLRAVRVTSDEFVRLIQVARDSVQGHFRGEYGAKLALTDPRTAKPILRNPGNDRAVRDFLAQRDTLTEEQKKALLTRIHPQRRDPTLHCTQCHRAEGSLVDFSSIGYPPARVQAMSSPQVTSAIDNIVQGRQFHLPEFLGPKD